MCFRSKAAIREGGGYHSAERRSFKERVHMSDHVYKSIELTGSSKTSIDDAIHNAVARAAETVRNMRWLEVVSTRAHLEDGEVAHWQVTIKIGFTLEPEAKPARRDARRNTRRRR